MRKYSKINKQICQYVHALVSIITDMLRRGKGQLSEKQVQRVGIMSGEYGRVIDQQMRQSLGLAAAPKRSGKKKQNYIKDLDKFCLMNADQLFHYNPGRTHVGFPSFKRESHIKCPEKLAQKLVDLSKEMDFWERKSRRNLRRN